jgi:hypothetical protein
MKSMYEISKSLYHISTEAMDISLRFGRNRRGIEPSTIESA